MSTFGIHIEPRATDVSFAEDISVETLLAAQ
jgi:hypothetical protein